MDKLRSKIEKRAYELYLSHKDTSQDPLADWVQAEREILAQSAPAKKKRAARKKK